MIDISYLDYQTDFFFDWPEGIKYKVCAKGRRVGVTRGAAHAFIEWLLEGDAPLLWGETTHGNIERYFERYFAPILRVNKIVHNFDKKIKQLTIGESFCDFRSADTPENWEGFGYKKIFLNEAGIILKDRHLYINSVLPMLLDFPDSKLIAAGVPKGKKLKDGTEHPFYTLAKRALAKNKKYEFTQLTSYDNPMLTPEDIAELEEEIRAFSPDQIRQEIYGEFIESDALNPFAHRYNPDKHESRDVVFIPSKQIVISTDFNINPLAVTFSHIWEDNAGLHDHQFDEMEIKHGSIPELIDRINDKYGRYVHAAKLTGDGMGNRGDISQRDNASIYQQILRGLRMSNSQLWVAGNPTHENSRADANFVLEYYPDFKINPDTCPITCRDLSSVQCDAYGVIIKKNRTDVNQRADFLDAVRYKVHNFHRDFIKRFQSKRKLILPSP